MSYAVGRLIMVMTWYPEEWEALMIQFCSILGVRNITEQPVGSRFFRHPDMVEPCMQTCPAEVKCCKCC